VKNCFVMQNFFLHLTGGQADIFHFRESEESLFSLTDLYKCMKNETIHVCEIYGTRCEIFKYNAIFS
jgi:hypothetical protein